MITEAELREEFPEIDDSGLVDGLCPRCHAGAGYEGCDGEHTDDDGERDCPLVILMAAADTRREIMEASDALWLEHQLGDFDHPVAVAVELLRKWLPTMSHSQRRACEVVADGLEDTLSDRARRISLNWYAQEFKRRTEEVKG